MCGILSLHKHILRQNNIEKEILPGASKKVERYLLEQPWDWRFESLYLYKRRDLWHFRRKELLLNSELIHELFLNFRLIISLIRKYGKKLRTQWVSCCFILNFSKNPLLFFFQIIIYIWCKTPQICRYLGTCSLHITLEILYHFKLAKNLGSLLDYVTRDCILEW